GIEGGGVEHQRDVLALMRGLHAGAVLDDGAKDALGGAAVIAEESGGAGILADIEPDGVGRGVAGAGPAGARLLLPLRHRGFEAVEVDGKAARAQRVLGQVERKAVGVVEAEGGLASQRLAGLQPGYSVFQQRHAAAEGAQEAFLLLAQRFLDYRTGAAE